jgi:hypothetical protein
MVTGDASQTVHLRIARLNGYVGSIDDLFADSEAPI